MMTKTALIAEAVKMALHGNIDAVEACFDKANEMLMTTEEKYEVDCIIADCCAIADKVRA
jgi:hypothetical protein